MLLHHILYTVYKWGSFCTIPILALDVYVIIYYVKYIFGFLVHSKTQENLMRPLIPGYNVTGVNILYFIFSVVISSIFHEFGHYFCAKILSIKVYKIKFGLYYVIPYMFVQVDNHSLSIQPFFNKYMFYASGIFHNILLTFFAILFTLSNQYIIYISSTNSVMIYQIKNTAYSSDTYGFKPFDIIYNINCQTINFQNLTNYLLDNLNHPTGFCLSETATQLVCQQNDSDCKKFKNAQINNQSVFLNVRNVMESNCCQNDKDCNSLEDDNFEGKKCFFPESSAVMAKIEIKKSQHYRIVADMKDFIDNVILIPETKMPNIAIDLFVEIHNFLLLLTSISIFLAMVNVLPVNPCDGYMIYNLFYNFFNNK